MIAEVVLVGGLVAANGRQAIHFPATLVAAAVGVGLVDVVKQNLLRFCLEHAVRPSAPHRHRRYKKRKLRIIQFGCGIDHSVE